MMTFGKSVLTAVNGGRVATFYDAGARISVARAMRDDGTTYYHMAVMDNGHTKYLKYDTAQQLLAALELLTPRKRVQFV